MNHPELNEERFQLWLERLVKCLDSIPESGTLSSSDKENLLEIIKITTNFDKDSVPAWAMRNDRVLSCLSSTSDDLKSRLRRLTLPKLSNTFDLLKSAEIETNIENLATKPLKREKSSDYSVINEFFKNLEQNPKDVVVGICKLADYGSRFNYVKDLDNSYMAKLIQFETSRLATSEQELTIRRENLRVLEQTDDEQIISTSLVHFQDHLAQLRFDLKSAEKEEEIAKQAYEAAMLKAKKSKESVENFENFIDIVGTQSEVLTKVNAIKIQLDTFNSTSASNRLKLFDSLQIALQSDSRVLQQRIKLEFPILLQNLSEIFRTMIKSIDYVDKNRELCNELSDQPVSMYCAVRIGLETINLWRRLDSSIDTAIDQLLNEFSAYLTGISMMLSDAPVTSIDCGTQFKDSTVVLFYNHLCHETPGNHVENQSRVDSCLKLLSKKAGGLVRNHSLLHGSTSTVHRQLVLEKCNDILSPPLWSLPLVHGPQYLTQLWKYSEEASEEDLYVPLEFETEWETDDEELDPDIDERTLVDTLWKRRKNSSCATLASTVEIDDAAKEKLGCNSATKLSQVLTPRFGDFLVARALKKNVPQTSKGNGTFEALKGGSKVESGLSSLPRIARKSPKPQRMEVHDSSDDVGHDEKFKASKVSKAGRRVRTPFGSGTLLDALDIDEESKSERIVRVKLDWGATGYLNTKVLHRVRRQRSSLGRDGTKEKSDKFPSSTIPDRSNQDRFLYTNFTVHRIVRRILAQVKVQRLILDRFGVKDAHLSLWIHGRTSKGITKNIENGIMDWLSKYNRKQLEDFLTEKEEAKESVVELCMSDIESGSKFMKELDALKLSDVSQPKNLIYYLQDPQESREKLIEEGFAYSAQRLTKKSGEMRAKTVKTKRKSKIVANPVSDNRNLLVKKEIFQETEPPRSSVPVHRLLQLASNPINPAPVVMSPVPRPVYSSAKIRSPKGKEEQLFSPADGEKVRWIFHRINTFMNISQTWFANELSRRYGVKTSQTTISAWTRNKASNISNRILDVCVLRWVDHHKRLLSQVDLTEWEDIVSRYRYILDEEDDHDHNITEDNIPVHIKPEFPINLEQIVRDVDDTKTLNAEVVDDGSALIQMDHEGLVDEPFDGINNTVQEEIENDPAEISEQESDMAGLPIKVLSDECLHAQPMEISDHSSLDSEAEDGMHENHGPFTNTIIKSHIAAADLSSSEELVSESEHEVDYFEHSHPDDNEDDLNILMKELKKLLKDFVAEQNRRSLTHSYIAQEATRLDLKLPQPSISKLCREHTFPFVNRAREFLNHLARWIAYSRTKVVEDVDDDQSGNVCSGCGEHRAKFASQKDFLHHIGVCPAKNDTIPLEAKVDKYPLSGPFFVLELNKEQSEIERHVQSFMGSSDVIGDECFSCFVCGRNEDIKSCGACTRWFHPSCTSVTVDSDWCATCKQRIRRTYIKASFENVSIGSFVLAFNLVTSQWQDAAVLYKLEKADRQMLLVKFLFSPVALHSNEGAYCWIELRKENIFISRTDSEFSWRRRNRKASSLPTRKRSVGEMEGEEEDGGGADEDIGETYYGRRTRPRRVSEEQPSERTGRGNRKSTGGRGVRGNGNHPSSNDTVNNNRPKPTEPPAEEVMSDTYLSANTLKAALCAAGIACRAVDIVMTNRGSNAFVCTRPPGHHAGRYGLTRGCLGTGFCLLNNAAIALTYARVRWGIERIAVVDIDVHFGNGTADILKNDKNAFFASVHMIYGQKNDGVLGTTGITQPNKNPRNDCVCGFFPSKLGTTSISDNFISVGVFPQHLDQVKNRRRRPRRRVDVEDDEDEEDEEFEAFDVQKNESDSNSIASNSAFENFVGAAGFVKALKEVVIPRMELYQPQLLIISAGFDGFSTDPLGGEMGLSLEDITFCTNMLTSSINHIARKSGDPRSGRIISLLEGGYDTSAETLGLARCVDAHVTALRSNS